MEIAIMAGFFTKRNMKIDACHKKCFAELTAELK
jgi:hypothetical protein